MGTVGICPNQYLAKDVRFIKLKSNDGISLQNCYVSISFVPTNFEDVPPGFWYMQLNKKTLNNRHLMVHKVH